MIQNKLFKLRFSETINGFDDIVSHHVWSLPNDDDININFYVHDLVFDPEDARIGRDLFDGQDYLQALMTGFRIADAGYTGIHIEEVDEDDYDTNKK